MREIPLTRGMIALVDDGDYAGVVAAGKWCAVASTRGGTYYAVHSIVRASGGRVLQRMHNFLTGWSLTDHVNGDGLDNRRGNLRQATHAQNMGNQRLRSNNTSGYKGVSRSNQKWQAHVFPAGRSVYLGRFATPEEAARAYDDAAAEHFGEFARLNFPVVSV